MNNLVDIADSLDGATKAEADLTRQDLGVRLVELLGRSPTDADGFTDDPRNQSKTAVNEYGVGVNAADRVASVSPLAIGDALMVMTAAFGDIGSRGAPVVIGRIARGQSDSFGTFFERKTYGETALRAGVDRDHPAVTDGIVRTQVRIPTNRAVALIGLAFATIGPATAKTQVDMHLRIGGTSTDGTPDLLTVNPDTGATRTNRDGAVGPAVSAGGDTNIQTLIVPHVRVLMVAGDNDYSDINVNIRFSSFGGASNSRLMSAWCFGVRVVL